MGSLVICPALSDNAAALARVLIDSSRVAHRDQVTDHLLDATPLVEKYARSERNWRRDLDKIAAVVRPLERTFEDEGELLPSTVYGWTASDAARFFGEG